MLKQLKLGQSMKPNGKQQKKVCEVNGWKFELMTEKQLQPDK